MPIKRENRDRYPADWQQVRARILARAEGRCEGCGLENRTWIQRLYAAPFPGEQDWRPARPGQPGDGKWKDAIRVVLTIHHVDAVPENCADDNLLSLCQRCHNRADAAHRKRNASATRAKRPERAGQGLLFPEVRAHA